MKGFFQTSHKFCNKWIRKVRGPGRRVLWSEQAGTAQALMPCQPYLAPQLWNFQSVKSQIPKNSLSFQPINSKALSDVVIFLSYFFKNFAQQVSKENSCLLRNPIVSLLNSKLLLRQLFFFEGEIYGIVYSCCNNLLLCR